MQHRANSLTERVRQDIVDGKINNQVVTQIVFRDPVIVKAVQDLKEVFGKSLVKTYTIGQSRDEVIVPMVDVEMLLGYLISDLSLFIQGAGDIRGMAKTFFELEVFDRSDEIDTELYSVVLDEVVSLIQYLISQLQTTDFDHHAYHTYDLIRVLPSNGLALIRAAYRS